MKNNTEIQNQKRRRALRRVRLCYLFAEIASAILALACLIGIVVSVLMLNFGSRSEHKDFILYVLSGSFAGGAALTAFFAWLFAKLTSAASYKELDFCELLDGEESFYVGEGTLITFGQEGVTLHGEGEGKSSFIPYRETRYISICTRRRPREKGDWCVAIEMPVKYISKNGEGKEGEKVLVQADAKERLYRALEKHSLTLLGEKRIAGAENKKFTPVQKFFLPNRRKRKNALFTLVAGVVAAGGALPLGFFVSASLGALLGAVGLILSARGILSFLKAKAVFGIYEEGIFWRESSGIDSLFLKWDDVEKVAFEEKNNIPVITFRCSYGKYSVPAAEGAYERIKRLKEEKCTEEK